MDGTTLAREAWKRFEQAPSRPVMILMTGGMSGESSRQANDYFDAVLVKPVNSVQIRKLIEEQTGTTDVPLPQPP